MPAPKKQFPRFSGWSLVRPYVQRHLDKLAFPKPADGPEREDFVHVCYRMAVAPHLLRDRNATHPDVQSFTRYFARAPGRHALDHQPDSHTLSRHRGRFD